VMFCLFFIGLTRADQGRISEALATFHEAMELSRRNGDLINTLKIPNSIGWVYREMGDFDRALDHDLEGVRISQQHKVLEAEINSLINVGYDHTLKGQTHGPLAHFQRAEVLLHHDDWFAWRFNLRLQAGKSEYSLSHADLDGAEQCAGGLLEKATQYGANKYIAIARKQLAEVASKRGDYAVAIDHLNTAVDVLALYPTPILAWKVYAALGRVLLAAEDEPSARNAFTQSMGIVDRIAGNITDEALRHTFLNFARRHM
jgi:tetratricopeptide (TPR) repeat protein